MPNRQPGAIVGLHYHLHQADYWYVPFGTARVVLHDLRDGSPTDGATHGLDLVAASNHTGVFIPPGVAHGFAALTDMTITYLVDGYYNPADELGVAWDDPAIAADWGVTEPILSERDQTNPMRADLAIEPPALLADAHLRERTMKLFVTGAAGFIGSNYVRHVLATTDDAVTVYDALTYAGNLENLRDVLDDARSAFVQGDICDRDDVARAMDGHDAVVHFAAESHVDRSIEDGSKFVRTNCIGTNVMCDVAHTVGVGRFLHISTDEVYGSIEEGSSVETDLLAPRSPYSASKAGSDLIALSLLRDLRPARRRDPLVEQLRAVPVPREGHPAVHHQPARRQAGAAVRRRSERARLDLRRGYNIAVDLVLERARGEIYNIGAGNEITNLELTHRLLGADGPRRVVHPARRGSPRSRPPLLDQHRQGQRARLDARRARSTRRSPRPSSGTATTAPGGSR